MKTCFFSLFLFFLTSLGVFAQTINGKVIDTNTALPIPNVTIQVSKNIGSFTDENGLFNIQISNSKKVIFSCLGYQTRTIAIDSLKILNFIVKLKESENNLEEVVLGNHKISFDSIMQSVRYYLKVNYSDLPKKRTIFMRYTNQPDFKKVDFELDRNTLISRKRRKLANKDFEAFSSKLKKTKTSFSADYYGNYYSKIVEASKRKRFLSSKIDSIQGYRLLNNNEDITLESVQANAQILFLSQLNKQKTYKLKSGLFKLEDSVSIIKVSKELKANKDSINLSQFSEKLSDLIQGFRFTNKKNSTNFLDNYYYKHQIIDTLSTNSSTIYVVSFSPKRSKAKYNGKLYIDADDYAITKIEYQFAKGKKGTNLNLRLLLGVKFSENFKKGALLFKKGPTGFYQLTHAKEKEGRYFYLNRSLKFIENSKAREKVKFGFKIEGNFYGTTEMVVIKTELIDNKTFNKKININKGRVLTKKEYDTTTWKNAKLLQQYQKQ
ncbi:MAG: carboxypeptidase-like regulatory domain-containing protein [Polaribacter sp.]|nr:carboxypeptidase-like regulatory domain-containing protein [Polaribacter sp.]MDG1992897.1 carboxypeptidase-like regulatory domain-containing protein [Polaribacter sp.]